MIILYTGHGKGKTCACVGQAMRAMGQGMPVAFGQFMKRDGQAGEQRMLSRLFGDNFCACGAGFFRHEADRAVHRSHARELLDWAMGRDVRMLVLDEAIYALGCGLIEQEDILPFIARSGKDFHLVLSGRNAPAWLVDRADIVTEMQERKHPHANGIKAAPGIEY